MPFTSVEDQAKVIANGGKPITVGDMCREEYTPIIRTWRENPRWATWHNMFRDHFGLSDQQAAEYSAWAVFFCKEVMKYEDKKCSENGDVY